MLLHNDSAYSVFLGSVLTINVWTIFQLNKGEEMNDLKNKVTNVIAFIVAIGTVIATALGNVPEDAQWFVWVGAAVVAVFGYFMSKNPDGSVKKSPTNV